MFFIECVEMSTVDKDADNAVHMRKIRTRNIIKINLLVALFLTILYNKCASIFA